MASPHEFGRAVGGLYRILLEPDGVLDLFDTIDQVTEQDGESDVLLRELHAQFLLAMDVFRKAAPAELSRPIESVLLSRSRRIMRLDDQANVFPRLLKSMRIDDPFVFSDEFDQLEATAALDALRPGGQRFLTVHVEDALPVTIALYRREAADGPVAPGGAEFFVSALQAPHGRRASNRRCAISS